MGGKNSAAVDVNTHATAAQATLGLPQLSVLQEEWNKKAGPKGATFAQFKSLMHRLDDAKLEQLYRLYDLDHDNLIDWNEFICCIVIICSGKVEDKLALMFNAFDNNLDRKISKKEFKQAVAKFCAPYQQFSKTEQKEFINKTFKECDSDNNRYITLDEFTAWTKRDPETFKAVVGLLGAEL